MVFEACIMTTWLCRTSEGLLAEHLAPLISEESLWTTGALVAIDLGLLRSRFQKLCQAFPSSCLHAVAVKANPLLEVLKLLVLEGAGLEVASSGELALALAAGCPTDRIVLDSPAKSEAELKDALSLGVRINANSEAELQRLSLLVDNPGGIGLRINPVVAGRDRESATMVATQRSKFGVNLEQGREALKRFPWVEGLHVHVGSQVATLDDLVLAAYRVHQLAREFPQISWIDIGGGLPTRYRDEDPGLEPQAYVLALKQKVPKLFDYPLVTEVGRALHAGCGWAVSRVEYADSEKAILHLGADFALREAYQPQAWFHEISVYDATGQEKSGPSHPIDLYGPLCFSGDCLARGRLLPVIDPGDLVVFHDVGAYTFSMWSRYCSRPMPTVVGLMGKDWTILRYAETPKDLVRFWGQGGAV